MIAAVLALLLSAVPPQPGGTAVVFERAAKALSAGDLAAAEQGFLSVLKSEPNSVPALGNLGVTYARMERYTDAIAVYRRALKLIPGQPGLVLNLAIAYVKAGDYAEAKPLLLKLPPTTQTRELLATSELFTGNPAKALDLLDGLPATPEVLFVTGTAHLRLKHSAEAQVAFRQMFESTPAAQAHLLMGRAYADATLFDEALTELKRAVELDPSSMQARLDLAKIYISLRDNESAERELRRISTPEAAYYLGAVLVQEDKNDEAIPILTRSITARPDAWGGYYYLGRAWLQKQQFAKAVPLLEKASRLGPDEQAVWFQLAKAYQANGQPDKAKAARARHTALAEKNRAKESGVIGYTQQQ